jgi:hypothetical protein
MPSKVSAIPCTFAAMPRWPLHKGYGSSSICLGRWFGCLAALSGVDQIVASGEALPAFDLHCPMMSLPLALRTTIDTIPADVPYLHPDEAQVRFWQERLGTLKIQGRRIGVAWAGNPRPHILAAAAIGRRRSIAPDRLAPLFELPGSHFFSLQKDGPPAPADLPLIDFMAEMRDFADTAALIANLDLIISVPSGGGLGQAGLAAGIAS